MKKNKISKREKAVYFLEYAHLGQYRMDGKTEYRVHPMEVALKVQELFELDCDNEHDENVFIAALLHDVIEDTNHDLKYVITHFGAEVGCLVNWVTKVQRPSNYSKGEWHDWQYQQLGRAAPDEAIMIKIADRLDNLKEIEKCPSNFIEYYIKDSRLLANALKGRIGSNFLETRVKELEEEYADKSNV
jgi:guanosine-3',5'-bis(diphosphate) 3'-pyrophosphohydrolase